MAGSVVGEAFVAIRPQTEGFAQEAQSKIAAPLQAALGGIATGLVANKVKDFFGSAISGAQEAQKVSAQTAAVIKSTGEAAGISADHVDKLAGSLSDMAAIDDEVIQQGENVLLTFTNIRNEAGKGNDVFDRATTAALNMSVALGTDLQGSVIQVGKALNDPIAGITALQRVGVSFTQSQKDMVAALVQSGDTLGAQKLVLAELEKEFGGAAASQATDAARLSVAFGNLKESIGTALLPVVSALAAALTPIAKALSENQVAATALAVVISGALLAGLIAWTVNAGLAAAATLGLTAASAEGTVAATGLGSALGKGAAAAAVGVGSYEATTLALHALFDIADKVTPEMEKVAKDVQDIAKRNDDELVPSLNRAADAFIRQSKVAFLQTGQGAIPTRITAQLKVFNDLLDTNAIAAQRVATQFKDHPALYAAMTAAIEKHNQELRNQRGETMNLQVSQFLLNATTRDWLGIINSQIDASLDSQGAAVAMDQAIKNLNETLFTNKEGTLEARQATVDAERAVISFGNKIFDEREKLVGAEQATRDQIGALAGVRDSLAPGSPLRVFLDQYIDKLEHGIPSQIWTQFRLRIANETGLSLADLDQLDTVPVFQAAAGGFFPAKPGGYLVQVGEGGQDEVVGTEEQMRRLYGGSGAGGDTYVFQGIVPANDPVKFGHIAARTLRMHLTMASR